MKILIDTNIIIYFTKGDVGARHILEGREVAISDITEMELLSFPNLKKQEEETIKDFINAIEIFPFDSRIKKKAISLRRDTGLKLLDAVILSTSLIHKLPFVTADQDFQKAKNADIIFYKTSDK